VIASEKIYTGDRDTDGHMVFEYENIKNDFGELIRYREYIIPPTVGGLCGRLGIHRGTWARYCNKDLHPELSNVTQKARERIRGYLEEQLLVRKDVKGIIFDLQNNHGYSEKREIKLDPKADIVSGLSIKTREGELAALAREFNGKGSSGKKN
jgi:hypothetical protein